MRNEFEFSDCYFLNEVNVNNQMSSEEISAIQDSYSTEDSVIEISGMSEKEGSVIYTYEKFLEILDTQGLEGLVNA